jgi:methyltransferase
MSKKRPRDYNNNSNNNHNKRERSSSGSYKSTVLYNNATDGDATEALWSTRPGREYTVSIALPGSIIQNAQSRELRTYLAGQIGRALAIFNIDEVVVFDDRSMSEIEAAGSAFGDPNMFLVRILQYLECPQYLRKKMFALHPDLKFAGLLNPIDAPHHMRANEDRPYREGVIVDAKANNGKKGSLVHVGTRQYVQIGKALKPGVRVTVEMKKKEAVEPTKPTKELGVYWGYNVRFAKSFKDIFVESPYKEGYDCAIGTSENGSNVSKMKLTKKAKHAIVVFGGLAGLEATVEADESLNVPRGKTSNIFDHYVNVYPNQGSRTIRTEEAILMAMSILGPKLEKINTRT